MTVVKYVSHTGIEFILDGAPGIGMRRGEVLDWEYDIQELGGAIDCLYRDTRGFDGKFFIGPDGVLTASERLDALVNLTALDVGANEPGKLYVGEWFVPVYLIGLEKDYADRDEVFECTGRFATDSPQWMRERKVEFRPRKDASGVDYPHDLPHDYSPSWFSGAVKNESPLPCAVRICVEGPADDWSVRIGTNTYSCKKALKEGESLLIDGLAEEIWFTDNLGNRSNAFSTWGGIFKEGSGSFVFERVPPDYSPISWENCDALSITLCEVRDEWLWGSAL
ncbi:MAG: hypothetical protein HFJ65_03430 [Eggerthellaceae bacterium]|nr:hypothetical protein [Eggerthellaceae bacterium]